MISYQVYNNSTNCSGDIGNIEGKYHTQHNLISDFNADLQAITYFRTRIFYRLKSEVLWFVKRDFIAFTIDISAH